jgi:hypothetical protein
MDKHQQNHVRTWLYIQEQKCDTDNDQSPYRENNIDIDNSIRYCSIPITYGEKLSRYLYVLNFDILMSFSTTPYYF